jgi:hypothetical protein
MEKFNFFKEKDEGIPDEDVINWIKTLREGGMNENEIDLILEANNLNYRKAKNHTFEKELQKILEKFEKENNRTMTADELDYYIKGIKIKLGIK